MESIKHYWNGTTAMKKYTFNSVHLLSEGFGQMLFLMLLIMI